MSYSPPTPQWQLRQVVKTLERIASELVDLRHAETIQSHACALAEFAEVITPTVRPDMLTPAQARILAFIRTHIASQGRPPTRPGDLRGVWLFLVKCCSGACEGA